MASKRSASPGASRCCASACRGWSPCSPTLGGLDLTLTTNGALLAKNARALKAAGLNRVTVSLDALDDGVFRAMNDVDFPVAKVLEGIDAAAAAGLDAGQGQHGRQARHQRARDPAHGAALQGQRPYPALHRVHGRRATPTAGAWTTSSPRPRCCASSARRCRSCPSTRHYVGEVATRWRYADGSGEIGVISSVTQAFCGDCTRARLSTEGRLYTCLFATQGFDLRALLRDGSSDERISDYIAAIWLQRGDRYSAIRSAHTVALPKIEMSYIGG